MLTDLIRAVGTSDQIHLKVMATKLRTRKAAVNIPADCPMTTNEIMEAITEGFAALAPNQTDHDAIIRLQAAVESVGAEVREMRKELEASGKDKESRLRTVETTASTTFENAASIAHFSERVRSLELGGAKLSGTHTALVFLVPIALSTVSFIINYMMTHH